MEHQSENGRQDADGKRPTKSECSVRFDDATIILPPETIWKACENGQLVQCLDEGMGLSESDVESAITHVLSIGNLELAEWLLSTDRCVFDYAVAWPRAEVIEKMLECGYLQFNDHRAAPLLSASAHWGRMDLVCSVVQLHSPLPKDHKRWVDNWVIAAETACRNGHVPMLQWLMAHPLWTEVCESTEYGRNLAFLLPDAAEGGHVEVMEFLYCNELSDQVYHAMLIAIKKGQTSSVKWLLDRYARELDAKTARDGGRRSGYTSQ